MSQSTLDDDELFGEAADEVRADVEAALDRAREALPAPAAIWEVEGDNALGMVNTLKSAMAAEEVEEHLRDAKKWHTMGERAGAFEDGDDLAAEIEAIEGVLADLEEAQSMLTELAGTLPELRKQLDETED
ncbi:MAG: DUF5790 family protein [Halobacteriaceae archaeon]